MSSSFGAYPRLFMPCLYVVQSATWWSADPQFAHDLRLSISSLGLYHDDLWGWPPPCVFLFSEYEYFLGFISMYFLDFCLISSEVGALSFDNVYYVANIVLKSSLFTPSMNFEAMLKFLLFVDSSGSLLLLKLSRSSRNRSIDSSSVCLLFSNRIIAW